MALPDESEPPPKKLTLKGAEFESVNESAAVPPPVGNDPMDMLRINREHEQKIGYCELPPPPKRKISRRNQEYLVFLAAGNFLLAAMMIFTGNIFLLPAMALYSASLTWVMLFIFDDY